MELPRAVRYIRTAAQPASASASAARASAARSVARASAARSVASLPEVDVVQTLVDDADAGRPQLRTALEVIAAGGASVLLVSSMRTVASSLRELIAIIDWLEGAEATLLTEDAALDTASSTGRAAVAVLREVASWDEAPDMHRPRPGRPGLNRLSPELVERIVALRASGMSLQAVADQLNVEGTPTPRGGARWRPSSVQTALGYRRPPPPVPGIPPLPAGPEGQPGLPPRPSRPGPAPRPDPAPRRGQAPRPGRAARPGPPARPGQAPRPGPPARQKRPRP